jgi:hypothetical protein
MELERWWFWLRVAWFLFVAAILLVVGWSPLVAVGSALWGAVAFFAGSSVLFDFLSPGSQQHRVLFFTLSHDQFILLKLSFVLSVVVFFLPLPYVSGSFWFVLAAVLAPCFCEFLFVIAFFNSIARIRIR